MEEYCFYRSVSKIIGNKCILFLFLLAMCVPAVGCVLFLWVSIGLIQYLINLSVYRKNRAIIYDPFQRMIFCPELCRSEKVINKYYEIKVDGKNFLQT
jgi:hypothetical protein